MVFRSLGVSVFIVLVMFFAELPAYLNSDMGSHRMGEYGAPRRPYANDSGMTGWDLETLDNQSLNNMPSNDYTQAAVDYSGNKGLSFVLRVVINSTYGFSDFFKNVLQVEAGTAASYLLDIVGWLVILNYCLVLIQFLKVLGWAI